MLSDPPVKRRKKRDTERGNSSQHYLIATCFLSGVVAVLVLPLDKVRFGSAWVAESAGQSAPAEPDGYTESFWDNPRPSRGHIGDLSRAQRNRIEDESRSDFNQVSDSISNEDFEALMDENAADESTDRAEPLFGDRRLTPRERSNRSRSRTVNPASWQTQSPPDVPEPPAAVFSGSVISQPAFPATGASSIIQPGPATTLNSSGGGAAADSARIIFNFAGAPWSVVLQKLAEEAGYALEMKANPAGVFTYTDPAGHSVGEAIDIVNGFLIREGFILLRHGQLMLLVSVDDVPTHLVERLTEEELEDRGRFELVSVEVAINEASAGDLATELQPLMTTLGKIIPVASANRMVVTDLRERLQEVLGLIKTGDIETASIRSEVITLKNTRAEDVVKSLQQMMGNAVAVAANGTGGVGGSAAGNGAPVVSVVETNCIIIRGREPALQKIRDLVSDLDRLPAQVHIQAMLVEVELSDTDEFGVELGVQDSLLFRRSLVEDILTTTTSQSDPATGIVTTTQNIISSKTNPGFNFNNSPMGNNTAASPNRLGGQALSNLSVGRMNPDEGYGGLVLAAGSESLSVLLRALKANREVNILSRPTIRTVHNRKASIQMGAQVPVVDGVSLGPTGTANPVVRQDKAGIILEVTPKISDTGVIFLDVKAEKSEFRSGPGSGTPIFTDASNGNVIEAPIKDITEAIATVNITSGQTVVLAGMITSGEVESVRKIPIIGDWPIVGPLFRYEYYTHRRKELLIFLTPEIIYNDDDARRISQREIEQSKIDVMSLPNVMTCPPEMLSDPEILFNDAQTPAPGFKPMNDWYFPTFRKWGQSEEENAPVIDRSAAIDQFLTPAPRVTSGHSFPSSSGGMPTGEGSFMENAQGPETFAPAGSDSGEIEYYQSSPEFIPPRMSSGSGTKSSRGGFSR
jgi:type II secretory pathway component GspD/PulD (secretin)